MVSVVMVLEQAIQFDEAIRGLTSRGDEAPIFVHRGCVPLAEAVGRDGATAAHEAFAFECDSGYCEL